MKRLTLLVVLLIAHGLSFGQLIINGNFATNLGNDASLNDPCVSCGTCSCSNCTFSTGSVPNWERLFGSPNFSADFPGCITMVSWGNLGEAIVGNYPFMAGQVYEIHICVKELIHGDRIRVIAGKGTPPFDKNNGPINCGSANDGMSCQGHIPIPNPVPASSTTMREINHSNFILGDNGRFFKPTDNYDWIVVFPQGGDDCEALITISYCYVFPFNYFDNLQFPSPEAADWTSSYNPLDPETYFNSIIEIQPNSSNTKISNDPNGTTTMKAVQNILVDIGGGGDFFLATASNDEYFLAEIDEKYNYLGLCESHGDASREESAGGVVAGDVGDVGTTELASATTREATPLHLGDNLNGISTDTTGTGNKHYGAGNTGDHGNIKESPFASRIVVEPNPVHDKLSFIYNPLDKEMIDLVISDVLGRVVYKAHFNCISPTLVHESIDVSEFGNGLYFVTIRSGNQQSVKKITKL